MRRGPGKPEPPTRRISMLQAQRRLPRSSRASALLGSFHAPASGRIFFGGGIFWGDFFFVQKNGFYAKKKLEKSVQKIRPKIRPLKKKFVPFFVPEFGPLRSGEGDVQG